MSAALSFVLAGGVLTAVPILFDAEPAQAQYATGGTGRFVESIDWFEWGDDGATVPAGGVTRTNTRVIDGQSLATTCTISNISGGPLGAYRSGSWFGDALDDLYNVGGTGGSNEMVTGLVNQTDGATIDFRFACSVTLDGVSVPLQGLVVADAEASNWPNPASPDLQQEYVQATPLQPATWRIIDRSTAALCTTNTLGERSASNTLRMRPDGAECVTTTGEAGPMAVGFMDGATSADIQIKGGGKSAIALGVLLQTDFGDAPDSYGEAGSLFEPSWGGGTLPEGTTAITPATFTLANQGQPNTRLGATTDSEAGYQPSPDALADDTAGNTSSDEDAIAPPGLLSVTPGDQYTLTGVSCTGPGFVSGWIDWNGNGAFDTGEQSAVVPCVGTTTVDLTWTVPMDTVNSVGDDLTFLRLRIAGTADAASSPTGLTTVGEVEDHALNVAIPALTVVKDSDATADTRLGDVVTYSVTATNTGGSAFTDAYPAVVFDDLAGVLDDATYNDDATSDVAGDLAYAEPLISWSGSLDAGQSVTITYTVTIGAGGDRNVRNVAWVPNDPTTTEPPTCAAPVDGVDPDTGQPCAVEEYPLPALTIDKSADQTELPAIGDQVTYTVVVTNAGPGAYTATAPATATDDLADVLDDATFDDASLAADVGVATRSGNTLSWSGPLASGESATITYSVTYTGDGDSRLTNQACVPTDDAVAGTLPCDIVTIPGASLQQWKTATPSSDPVVAGSTITYTLFFDNDGQAAADIDAVDDLTHVLDDATVTTEPTSADGLTVVRDGLQISITGSVPAGERHSVTYTVTVLPDAERGDSIASNFLLAPGETPPTGPECDPTDPILPNCTTTPITGVTYSKAVEASESPVREGTELTYTITVTNTGATEVDVARDDDLADVLDDTTLTTDAESDTSSVTVEGPTDDILAIRGTLAAGETAQVTYTVTVKAATDRGNNSSNNYLVVPGTTPGECDPETEQCTVTPIQGYTVSKTADVESTTPGGIVTYTVLVTNTGAIDYTDATPATFTDDLSEVLDDAAYNGDITAGGAVTGDELTWSGPLAVGATATVTYSVTVNAPATGDGTLTNAVVPTAPGGECDPAGDCIVETPVSSFTVVKSVDVETAIPGDVVTYTITVTNTGEVDYTDAAPASFTDDLTSVLDDATYNDDASAGTVTDTTFSWSGPLLAGDTVAVTYSVTVNDPITGDQDLLNTVVPTAPGGSCDTEGGCTTTTPVASYTVEKSVDTVTALPGGVVTYTVTVTNTSSVDYTDAVPATLTDDLAGVLDDAVYNDDASSGATVTGSTLTWAGALPAGESVEITYSVTVDNPVTGDFVLRNAVTPTGPGGSCADVCVTETPLGTYRVTKSTDSTEVIPGETVEYTITVTNTGQVAYTDAAPASFSDDLSAVLDDAAYNGDATSSTGSGVAYTAPDLSWSGALGIGETVTITYSVTVSDPATGDDALENAVVTPPGTGGNCEPGSTDPDCVANVPSGSFTVEKSASPGTALPGDIVTYTITVTNTGQVAYTDAAPASFSDDLSRVLDDAAYNGDVSLGGAVSGTTLTWSRPLAVGEVVQVTYSVTVSDPVAGDFNLRNVVSPTAPGGECGDAGCVTDTPIASYTVQKSSDVISVVLGGVVTYTVTVTNTGQVAYTDANPASFTDDMSGVLDDATYNGDATDGATVSGSTLDWAGALDIGGAVTVTYSVTVNQPVTGDLVLRNAVVPDGPGGACVADGDCVTETPVATYDVVKTVSSDIASVGDRLTYTITVTNTGEVPYTNEEPASFTDDLSSALAIATYNDDASSGAVYDRPVLSWQGAVAVGESVSVTYSVTLTDVGKIRNVVVTPDDSGASCAAGSADPDCVTLTTVVPPGLAITGGVAWLGAGVAGALMLAFGLWFVTRRRREDALESIEL